MTLPSIDVLKTQAKRLRNDLESDGTPTGHSKSLELLAHQYGYKDWNTLHAAVCNRLPGPPVTIGERVRGHYLGQAFAGEVLGVSVLGAPGRYRVTFHFDEPVDVVTFESFSNLRRRVSSVINVDGVSAEKTSDGQPQMVLAL